VALSFDAWKAGEVRPALVEVPVRVLQSTASPQLKATLTGQRDAVGQVAWSPDGKTLAALVPRGAEVRFWDVAGQKVRATVRGEQGASYSLAFTPDGKTLALAHYVAARKAPPTGGISLWDVATARRKALIRQPAPHGVIRLALSPDGKTAATSERWREAGRGADSQGLVLWDLALGKPRARLADVCPLAVVFSPDGKGLAWEELSPQGDQLVGRVRRRDLTTGQDQPPLMMPGGQPVHSLAYAPDGRTIAAANDKGSLVLWDAASGKVRPGLRQYNPGPVQALAFSPDGKVLAAVFGSRSPGAIEPGVIALWDVTTGRRLHVLTGHTDAVLSVAFSPDGKLLASGGADQTVRLWDMKD
jgi:WD40 repeat protein